MVNAHQECGRNERWSDCAGCEVKCGETLVEFISGISEEECAENEKWLACKGCEETCEERAKNGGRPGRCTRKCHGRGCECVAHDEFVFVVSTAVAHQECGPNERWSECPMCELKCGQDEMTPCLYMCTPPACECPSDKFRRTEDGKCIPTAQCPQHRIRREHKCDENETWTECGGCEGTCDKRLVPCVRMCKPPSCECVAGAGFVRDSKGKCIKFDDCPK
ncbi:unnamed protein product [Anisakis simplex]|uniref:TIL domain-containing protein n=1 Tax=Anisakis simplex TaxID=6269 RepID=A0A3P6R385_ANISI|nr:unnamed protein product [Anisakis simplex]